MTVKIGIMGYGNLGKGLEYAIMQNSDLELAAVFTRRDPKTVSIITQNVKVYHADDVFDFQDKIDVLILCTSSAYDLPKQTARYASAFNVVDSFDTHAKIPEHFKAVDIAAKNADKTAVIAAGWDPGMFSLNRLYAQAILPDGDSCTFWGKGISQGHSDAIRHIANVKDARQYTIPKEEALKQVRSGSFENLGIRQKHLRECFVVIDETKLCHDEKSVDILKNEIEHKIKSMPDYFDKYDTKVHFISEEELIKKHSGMPHGGFVFHCGTTGKNRKNRHIIEYSLTLDSNPEFTASILAAYARAAYRLNKDGVSGAKTVFDIAPAYIINKTGEELRSKML